MPHCCNEPLQLKTRCVSSQVAGDATAHTVTIRSIEFMSDILASSDGYHKERRKWLREVSLRRENPDIGSARGLRPSGLEVNSEHQSRLVTFEIDEIEGSARSGLTAPSLNTPTRRQPRAFRQLE